MKSETCSFLFVIFLLRIFPVRFGFFSQLLYFSGVFFPVWTLVTHLSPRASLVIKINSSASSVKINTNMISVTFWEKNSVYFFRNKIRHCDRFIFFKYYVWFFPSFIFCSDLGLKQHIATLTLWYHIVFPRDVIPSYVVIPLRHTSSGAETGRASKRQHQHKNSVQLRRDS